MKNKIASSVLSYRKVQTIAREPVGGVRAVASRRARQQPAGAGPSEPRARLSVSLYTKKMVYNAHLTGTVTRDGRCNIIFISISQFNTTFATKAHGHIHARNEARTPQASKLPGSSDFRKPG